LVHRWTWVRADFDDITQSHIFPLYLTGCNWNKSLGIMIIPKNSNTMVYQEHSGQAVLGRQIGTTTPWLTERISNRSKR
ncbi:hypothetical protein AB7W42_23450, partial [Providencia rettgeri]